jgi:hypothetical protein
VGLFRLRHSTPQEYDSTCLLVWKKKVMHGHRFDGWRFAEFSKVRGRVGVKGLTAEKLGRDRGKSIKLLSDVIDHAGLR